MDVDGEAAADGAYDFAVQTAREQGNKRAARQLEAAGPPPHLTAKQFSTRVRWASTFGGVTTGETYGSIARGLVASLLRSPDYSLGDVVRTLRGVSATQGALLSELAFMDLVHSLPVVDAPIVMVQGRLDQVAPGEAAQRYFDQLSAPSKQLIWFEHSTHTPHLEEPDQFRRLMLQVRSGEYAAK
jgi:pimeloyl-ACP methyl ester carboxylesterase